MIAKIIKIYREESIHGLIHRIVTRLWGIKLRIWKYLNFQIIKCRYGVKLVANYSDKTFQYYVTGTYGHQYWQHLKDQCEDFVFLDIGSNQGLYTLVAAQNKHCLHAYAFEPVSSTFDLLERNVALNGLSQKCTLIRSAISDKTGKTEIRMQANHSDVASLHESNQLLSASIGIAETIDMISAPQIDDVFKDSDMTNVLVKIDVEGFELTVMSELMKTKIGQSIREIFYEVDEVWVDPEDIKQLLRRYGFKHFIKVNGAEKHYDVFARK